MAYALEMKARLQAVDMHEAVAAAAADGGLHIDNTTAPFAAPLTDVLQTTPYADAAPNTYLFDTYVRTPLLHRISELTGIGYK